MTISPYDNLPVGKDRQPAESPGYEDVTPQQPESADSAETESRQETSQDNNHIQPEEPRYVDIPVPASEYVPEAATPDTTVPARTLPMDHAPRYSKIMLKNIWGTKQYILPFEETLLVPDTMPDMEGVLFAEGSVTPSRPIGCQYEKNDQVSGEISLFTVYRPAGDEPAPVDVIRSSVSFKTSRCWENTDGDSFRLSFSTKSLSAEMINERKFKVKGFISIHMTEISHKELTLFKGTDDCNLVQNEASAVVTDLISETGDTTEISQEIDLREDQPSPVKILKESFNIIENHRQVTSGKLVVNGTVITDILYLGQDKEEEPMRLCSLTNKTDFTQFIVTDDDTDAEMTRISFIGDNLAVSIENSDQLMIKGRVTAGIHCYKNKTLPMVSDVYHKKQELVFDVAQQPVSVVADTLSGEISAREVISLDETGKKPSVFLCGSGNVSNISGTAENGRVIIEGSVDVKILALDENSNPFIIEKTMPLRGSLDTSATSEDIEVNIRTYIKEFWFDSINSRQMEINAGISLDVWVFSHSNFITLENLCFAENEMPVKHVPMAVYVADSGDTLWDIAKRYKSDTASLARLNQLDENEPLSEGARLFIMRQA